MQVHEIQIFTIQKAISQIGGFTNIPFMILGMISSFFLPSLFLDKLSKYFFKTKLNQNSD